MGQNQWDASCGRSCSQRKGFASIEDVSGHSVSVPSFLSSASADVIVPFILSLDGPPCDVPIMFCFGLERAVVVFVLHLRRWVWLAASVAVCIRLRWHQAFALELALELAVFTIICML